ncbi:MAG: hypothetical protein FDZ75_09540 [Actinobacteria bacterium]|nr:MAG: hypothetical protein FDZ75_09540 [Actinomycetota bacterium]
MVRSLPPEGQRSALRTAGFHAATLGTGVALGVALAAWVAASWGNGAPGPLALDYRSDLVLVPLLSGLSVFVLVFGVLVLVSLVRRAGSPHEDHDPDQNTETREN